MEVCNAPVPKLHGLSSDSSTPVKLTPKLKKKKNAFQQPLQGEEDPVLREEEEEAPIRLLKDQVKAKAILSGNVISSVYPQWIVT